MFIILKLGKYVLVFINISIHSSVNVLYDKFRFVTHPICYTKWVSPVLDSLFLLSFRHFIGF